MERRGSQSSDWRERQKSRVETLLVIDETNKLLNDEDAQGLFKATLPSPSLMEVHQNHRRGGLCSAMDELRPSRKTPRNSAPNLKLISSTLS